MLLNAGVTPRKFHAMRHTFATQALQRGVDVKDLQLIMGHANIQTTYGYIAVDMEAKRRAIERMGVMI
jgi:site-specific recombinase XerD